MTNRLSREQLERYNHQLIVEEIGEEGQKKLLNARVLIVGAGGLGSSSTLYLACAGVGNLGIVDCDKVELSNLQRQILHSTKSIGSLKVDSAKEGISLINPDINVCTYNVQLSSENINDIIKDYDFVIDATDNFPTRFLINDACIALNKPFSHGGVLRFDGQTFTIVPHKGPCYRCLFTNSPPEGVVPGCKEAGIVGVVPGIIGTIQATEALKFILGIGELLIGRFLIFNGKTCNFRTVKVVEDENCPACSKIPQY